MASQCLWTVDCFGSLHRLDLASMELERLCQYDPNTRQNTFKRIATSASCMWGIGGDQNVYMKVFTTDSPIIATEEYYENERWYMSLGFSKKSLISTDRPHCSSKDGKKERNPESIKLPNVRWDWQGDWYLDKTFPCDEDGWEYALDFPMKYYGYKAKTSFVRRRKWIRKRKFIGFDMWAQIPTVVSDDPFHDISVGGNHIPGQTRGFLSVWATTLTGRVFFRAGISRTCLEGFSWKEIKIADFNVVQISVGPCGSFWGVTWDGEAVHRKGIDHSNPSGTKWELVQPPPGQYLTQICVGSNALWAVSKEKKVFFNKLDSTFSSSWKSMVGEFEQLAVGPNDQLIGLSSGIQPGLFIRTSITLDELVGREWKQLNIPESVNTELMFCCISIGSSSITNDFVNSLGKLKLSSTDSTTLSIADDNLNADWRHVILNDLTKRNSKGKEVISKYNFSSANSSPLTKWSKQCDCKCLVDKHYDTWVAAHLKLSTSPKLEHGAEENAQTLLVYYSLNKDFKEWSIDVKDISCFYQLRHASRPYTLSILAYDKEAAHPDDVQQKVVLQFESEKLLREWMSVLTTSQQQISSSLVGACATEVPRSQIIVTSVLGDIYESIMDNVPAPRKWRHIEGHLKKVLCGWNGIVWGFGYDGIPYVRCAHKIGPMESREDHVIFENQRWNPVGGFTQRRLPSDRWHWSDASGRMKCSKDSYYLPTSNCRWSSQWAVDYDNETVDKEGWQYAVDFPWEYHKNKSMYDYVRRRRWKRTCQVKSSGPWEPVNTDVKIQDMVVSIEKDTYHLWAVSCYGDVLHRYGVSSCNTKGDKWVQVPTDVPIKSISISSRSRVLCVATDSSCYMRAGVQKDKTIGSHWLHLPREMQNICHVSAGRNVITAIDDREIAYLRENVTDIYPEGTSWRPLWENVSDISVNHLDEVIFVQNGDVILCTDVRQNPDGLVVILKDGWLSVCNRGHTSSKEPRRSIESPRDDEETQSDVEGDESKSTEADNGDLSFLLDEPSTMVDPYAIDIYSYYGNSKSNS